MINYLYVVCPDVPEVPITDRLGGTCWIGHPVTADEPIMRKTYGVCTHGNGEGERCGTGVVGYLL